MQFNYKDSKRDVSSLPLIEELKHDPTVMPNLPYKLRCSSMMEIILKFFK